MFMEIHALDPSGYGVFRYQGCWLVSHAGAWYRAVHMCGPFLPIASRIAPLALVALVAQACEREDNAALGPGLVDVNGVWIAVQLAPSASDT